MMPYSSLDWLNFLRSPPQSLQVSRPYGHCRPFRPFLIKMAMPTRGSVGCDDGKIRANECKGKFICTLLSAAEFG